jgi:hypothetical protein
MSSVNLDSNLQRNLEGAIQAAYTQSKGDGGKKKTVGDNGSITVNGLKYEITVEKKEVCFLGIRLKGFEKPAVIIITPLDGMNAELVTLTGFAASKSKFTQKILEHQWQNRRKLSQEQKANLYIAAKDQKINLDATELSGFAAGVLGELNRLNAIPWGDLDRASRATDILLAAVKIYNDKKGTFSDDVVRGVEVGLNIGLDKLKEYLLNTYTSTDWRANIQNALGKVYRSLEGTGDSPAKGCINSLINNLKNSPSGDVRRSADAILNWKLPEANSPATTA